MKKLIRFFPAIIVLCLLLITTLNTGAQSNNKIIISIAGIEFDAPDFTAFQQTLKKNTKVKSVKSSYAAETAVLTFTYPGDPAQLWAEIPKNSKLVFKLTLIDDNSINLDYVKAKNNGTVADKNINANPTNRKDCFDCDYFPLCKYDLTKSYGGREFRGIRKDDNSVVYYYCDKGDVIMRWDYTNKITRQQWVNGTWDDFIITYDDFENKTASLTILKSGVPVGTTWAGMASGSDHNFVLEAKGIKLIHDGKTYNDVIKVKEYVSGSGRFDHYYYAKNVGYVGKNLVDEQMKQRDAAVKSWVGVWKLTSDNGNAVSPDETTEYLTIDERGRADFSYYVKKKSTGKLYSVFSNKIPGYDPISGLQNQAGSVLYLRVKYASGKELDMNKKSVPKQMMIIGTKTYEYLGENYNFNQ